MITLTKNPGGEKVQINLADATRLEGLESGGAKVYPCDSEPFEVAESVDVIMGMVE